MGPCGIGRRTLEVKAEKELRECAEQRCGRLARDITKLASDTSQQQAAIAELGSRLMRAKKAHADRDRRLVHNQKQTKLLHSKLKVTSGDASPSPKAGAQDADVANGNGDTRLQQSRKKGAAASTGKLPSLSF